MQWTMHYRLFHVSKLDVFALGNPLVLSLLVKYSAKHSFEDYGYPDIFLIFEFLPRVLVHPLLYSFRSNQRKKQHENRHEEQSPTSKSGFKKS